MTHLQDRPTRSIGGAIGGALLQSWGGHVPAAVGYLFWREVRRIRDRIGATAIQRRAFAYLDR